MWIRSLGWDGFWILSGVPIGLLLFAIGDRAPMLVLIIVFREAHLIAPFALAWTHKGFRNQIIFRKPGKFITIPLVIVAAGTAIGLYAGPVHVDLSFGSVLPVVGAPPYLLPPISLNMLLAIYSIWNIWHFASQNFGILSIYRRKSGSGYRRADRWFCLGAQVAVSAILAFSALLVLAEVRIVIVTLAIAATLAMLLIETRLSPRVPFIVTQGAGVALMALPSGLIWSFAVWQLSHWLGALAVSGKSSGRRCGLFIAALVITGMILFWLLFSRGATIQLVGWAVGLRLGLGFVHFLYDRWLYRFSDPAVRATIGKAIFA